MIGQPQVPRSASRPNGQPTAVRGHAVYEPGQRDVTPEDVLQLIAVQSSARPAAAALAAGADVLSFAQLEARSSQLARHLKSLGVGPDQLVGLCMERSPSMVMAALAILKAGGAYIPLDSSLPEARLNFMLRDSGIRALVTRNDLSEKLPGGPWRVLDLTKHGEEIAAHPSDAFQTPIAGENLAYVIYTSGSTGQPKGVEITHRGLANLVAWHRRAFQVTETDRASHQAAVGFDASVWEVWPYLAAGASVHIPDESVRNDPTALRDWLVAERISITFLATPTAERMLKLDWPRHTALRILLTGADTLHQRPSSTLPFTLVNNYGPTECTVVATSGVVAPAEASNRLPSIGRPIDNTRIYILDEGMHPVPPGTAGELYVAGLGVARGYHNLPELTRQRFMPDPFSSVPGDRMYRTGDRARLLDNGEIEFLGRVDEQVKIRGFRVEPGEIVRALNERPDVHASAVVTAESQGQDQRLIAYVVTSPQAAVTASSLREHLRKQLPDYMIPPVFVRMDSLPVTVSGKVDRGSLPRPSASNTLREEKFVPPQGVVEQRLAPIIASLLHLDGIGAHDNFFFLGGHSLLGTQLLTKISEVFGVELTLLQLFDHPTLAEMSREIEKLILTKLETTASARSASQQSGLRSA